MMCYKEEIENIKKISIISKREIEKLPENSRSKTRYALKN